MPAEQAVRLHFATRDLLDRWFASPDTKLVAFFALWDLNYGWSLPSYNRTTDEARQHWLEVLRHDYTVALSQSQFVILARKDTPVVLPRRQAAVGQPASFLPPALLNSDF
jgi:hypothetical protein